MKPRHYPRAYSAILFLIAVLFTTVMAVPKTAVAQSYSYSWWSSSPEMTASITAPQYGASIPAGALVSCTSSAYDEDTLYTYDYSNYTSTTTLAIDSLSYSWSASGVVFRARLPAARLPGWHPRKQERIT